MGESGGICGGVVKRKRGLWWWEKNKGVRVGDCGGRAVKVK